MTPSPCRRGLNFPPIHACPFVRVHVIVTQNSTNLVGPVFVGMFYDVSFDTSLRTIGVAVKSSPFTCVPNVMYCLRKYWEKCEK